MLPIHSSVLKLYTEKVHTLVYKKNLEKFYSKHNNRLYDVQCTLYVQSMSIVPIYTNKIATKFVVVRMLIRVPNIERKIFF